MVNLFDNFGHRIDIEYIRDLKFHHFLLREVKGHGPGERIILKYRLATKNGREHDHTECYHRLGLGRRVPQPHVPKPFVEPLVYLHSSLDPDFRIKIVLPAKGDAVMFVKPVRIKPYPELNVI